MYDRYSDDFCSGKALVETFLSNFIITFVLYIFNLYLTFHSGSVFLKKINVEMVSFGFIKPPQKEMVHIPKSSSANTDIAEKEDRVELFDIRSLHLYVILHRPRGLS